ncbi:MAG: AEC family transporter [Candidatus Latescibacterota bacterium]|nr:MAG: AEC family transporter [Candidatus Latescibacterota bacterium]
MSEILLKLSPVFLTFALGVLLRRTRVLRKEDGGLLLKIVFYLALPSLILLSVPDIEISRDLVVLPIIAVVIVLVTGLAALLFFRPRASERPLFGVTIVGSMIMNTNFLYPFILVVYGSAGFATAVVFDVGNASLVLTLVYYIACRFGSGGSGSKNALRRLIASPPLWALAAGLILNVAGVTIGSHVRTFLTSIGNLLIPLVMLALGVYFSPRLVRWPLLLGVLLIRSGGGLILAFLFTSLFGLEGLTRSIVLICGAAPIGYNTLVFSSLAKLDVEFAASLLSTSILLGLLYVPFLMTVLQ